MASQIKFRPCGFGCCPFEGGGSVVVYGLFIVAIC